MLSRHSEVKQTQENSSHSQHCVHIKSPAPTYPLPASSIPQHWELKLLLHFQNASSWAVFPLSRKMGRVYQEGSGGRQRESLSLLPGHEPALGLPSCVGSGNCNSGSGGGNELLNQHLLGFRSGSRGPARPETSLKGKGRPLALKHSCIGHPEYLIYVAPLY